MDEVVAGAGAEDRGWVVGDARTLVVASDDASAAVSAVFFLGGSPGTG